MARLLVKKNLDGLWQWRAIADSGQWDSEVFYTGDINLLAESATGASVWLIFSGQHVVSRKVEVEAKDKRLFAKLVPFQIEETVIDYVDDMIFAYGTFEENQLPLAYVDAEFAENALAELEDIGAEVQSCAVDYLELFHDEDSWTIVLDGENVLVKFDRELGFSVEKEAAALYLKSLLASHESPPAKITIYGLDDGELDSLRDMLPGELETSEEIEIEERVGSFWDAVEAKAKPVLELRTGPIARKLPFAKWWTDWKVPAIAACAALLVAVGGTWGELKMMRAKQSAILAERDELYRQVKKGPVRDPVRQLKQELSNYSDKPQGSRLMLMMSKIAPPIAANDNLTLNNFRYSHDSGEVQLTIEATDFALFEELRKQIADKGLTVDIRRASVSGDVHQAQIRVSEG